MFDHLSNLKPESQETTLGRRYVSRAKKHPMTVGVLLGLGMAAIGGVGYVAGRVSTVVDSSLTQSESQWNGIPSNRVPPELLRASATHGGANMAIATGQVDENSEGFFTLDFLTGDLKCWVYYPRLRTFGGVFFTNVQPQLGPPSKNPEYLLITGGASSISSGSNVRPASSLVYVVDTKSGFFAAYTIPWNKSMESSGAAQSGAIVLVDGGQVRDPQVGAKKPVNPAGDKKGAPGAPGAPGAAAGAANAANAANRPAGAKPNANANADGNDNADPFGQQQPAVRNPNLPVNPRKPQ